MKKILAGLFALVAVLATVYFVSTAPTSTQAENDYLRIHVRANSNDKIDQEIKYIVKDEVVKFITPYITECTDKNAAIEVMSGILREIEHVCDITLRNNGFGYTSRAEIRAEKFPTRVYGDLTLETGIYDALIIELGSGTGDNWWCVIYPPLCFTAASTDVQYRSAIYEIINKFFK